MFGNAAHALGLTANDKRFGQKGTKCSRYTSSDFSGNAIRLLSANIVIYYYLPSFKQSVFGIITNGDALLSTKTLAASNADSSDLEIQCVGN